MIWQKISHPIEIYSPKVFYQKIDYIHNNPVEANSVTDPSCYFYSCANLLSPLETDE